MFDPYHKWLGIPAEQRPPTHYQLLGISPSERDLDVIDEAAIRQTKHLRDYQIGPQAADCTRLLNEVSRARTILLDPVKRQQYDATLAQQAAVKAAVQPRPAKPPALKPIPKTDGPKPLPPRSAAPHVPQPPRQATPLALYFALGGGVIVVTGAIVVVLWLLMRTPEPSPPVAKKVVPAAPDVRTPVEPPLPKPEEKPPAPVIKPAPPPPVVVGGDPKDPRPAFPQLAGGLLEPKRLHTDAGGHMVVLDPQHVLIHRSFTWIVEVGPFTKKKDIGYVEGSYAPRSHANGKALVTINQRAQSVDVATGAQTILPITAPRLLGLEYSPTGKYMMSHEDNACTLYDGKTYKRLARLEGLVGQIEAVAFFKDETRCLVGDRLFLHLVEIPALTKIKTWQLTNHQVEAVALAPDETVAAFTAEDHLHLFDLAKGAVLRRLAMDSARGRAFAFFPNQPWIAFGIKGDLALWNWRTMTPLGRHELGAAEIRQIAVATDGQHVFVSRGAEVEQWKVGGELLKK